MTDGRNPDPQPGLPHAHQRRTRWPGWVWLIPAAAVGFAAWLSAQHWLFGPYQLTVRFADVEGVKPGAPVRYRGVQVGSVDEIELGEDLAGARLVLDMTALEDRVGEGTAIWIVRPDLASGRLTNLISGAHLAIEPGGPGQVEELVGLEGPPIREPEEPGRTFVLTAETGEGLQAGAPVRFRGLEVGRVLGRRFGEGGTVEFPVFVEEPYAELVREATVFWRAGALSIDSEGGGIDLDLSSLSAIPTGAVAFATPEVLEGAEAAAGASFPLHDDAEAAEATATGPRLGYRVIFTGPSADLAAGAPVTLAGKLVGRVASSDLAVMPDRGGLVTEARIVIDARRMGMEELHAIDSRDALRERLNEIIGRLVQVGMRAEIYEGSIVFGAKSVALAIDPSASPAAFSPDADLPEIPAAGAVGSAGPAPAGVGRESQQGGDGAPERGGAEGRAGDDGTEGAEQPAAAVSGG